jgi:hypothetical protein
MRDLIAEAGRARRSRGHVPLAVGFFQEIGQFTERADRLIFD